MRLLRAASLTVPDADAALAAYVRWLGYVPVERGIVGDHLAASWGAPDSAGRAYAVAQPASGSPIFLRFVEGQTQADYRPLRTYGWAAIEICVQDTLAVARHLAGSPFEMIGPPRQLDGMPQIFPMQVKGPSGEIVYLTEIRGDLPDCDLPRAAVPIDCLFIAVLACSDLGASIDWFGRILGIAAGPPVAITYTMLAKAFDLPIEQKHRIAAGMHGRDCFLEFDQYPPQATKRPKATGSLPPGVALVTLGLPSIDAIDGDWITSPRPLSGAIYSNHRAGSLLAPDGTIVEIVEIAA